MTHMLLLLYTAISATLFIIIAPRVIRALRRYTVKDFTVADADAPSVSVLIPARNEMHALTECLNRVIASDYRKMEVIVYDDESDDETNHILKAFARNGVRFINGQGEDSAWLGRNYAINTLIKQATGTYILVLDVDTYITPTTISQLVGHIIKTKTDMISVIPGRSDKWRVSVLFGTFRSLWDVVLADRHKPVVASACWMAIRSTITDELGALEYVKADPLPERRLAAQLGVGRYRCTLNTKKLGITFEKKLTSQYSSAQRTLYPLFGKNPWQSTAMTLLFSFVVSLPIAIIWLLLANPQSVYLVVVSLLFIGYATLFGLYCNRIWNSWGWAAGLLWVYVSIQEFALAIYSQVSYWRGTVMWKGRNIIQK